MPKIVPIVEGEGEVKALPNLLSRILGEMQRWEITIGVPKNANGCNNLTCAGCLERFIRLALLDSDCAAVLVLLDADDGCPMDIAQGLAARAVAVQATVPIVVVVANCEYEAWFLASLETIAGQTLDGRPGIPAGVTIDNPESKVGAKAWITSQIPGARIYKETLDQLAMTRLIDINIAKQNSRSFQRLCHAIEQAVAAIDAKQAIVTPSIQSTSRA